MINRRMHTRAAIAALTLIAAMLVPTLALADPATTQRPLSHFLSQQGTFCGTFVGGEWTTPACEGFATNYLGFTGINRSLRNLPVPQYYDRFGTIDYAGIESVAGSLGTQVTGTVTERRLQNGTVEVKFQLHTRNALTQVRRLNFISPPPQPFRDVHLFGRAPSDSPTVPLVVGEILLNATIINPSAGAPLPDLVRYGAGDQTAPPLVNLDMQISATGPLRATFGVPDGTPGGMHSTQSNVSQLFTKFGCFNDPPRPNPRPCSGPGDGFPAEFINLNVVGR